MDDNAIIDLYIKREESAIARTEEKYGARLRSLACGILKDAESAEECENDTLYRAWNSIPPKEPREHFFAYLARITRNLSLNLLRDRKEHLLLTELGDELQACLPSADRAESRLEESELVSCINRFLASQSREKRIIFLRRYYFFDSVEEIAGRLGISRSKVKVTLYRCREGLRTFLQKEGYTP